jgi:hypothetical protein
LLDIKDKLRNLSKIGPSYASLNLSQDTNTLGPVGDYTNDPITGKRYESDFTPKEHTLLENVPNSKSGKAIKQVRKAEAAEKKKYNEKNKQTKTSP